MQTEGKGKTQICRFAKSTEREREREESAREREKIVCREREREIVCCESGTNFFVVVSIDLGCLRREGGREGAHRLETRSERKI
jgi:hypothetical protein